MFFVIAQIQGQNSESVNITEAGETFEVAWVSYYPDPDKIGKKSLIKKFSEFLFGENPEVSCLKPISVFARDTGNFYILDQGYENIISVNQGVGEMPHYISGQYPSLVGICSAENDDFLFTDSRLNKVFKFSPNQQKITEWIVSIQLSQPTGIAFSGRTNEIWVVETSKHRIAVFDIDGELKRYIGERGNDLLRFNYPTFIWIDKDGFVYIVDSMNFRIQILNNKGEFFGLFGEIGNATGYFARPKGVATDSYGNIYIVDALFHAVQIFDRQGNFLYSFGEQGRKLGEFWMPTGIFIDEQNYIYVSDSYNSRLQIFKLVKK